MRLISLLATTSLLAAACAVEQDDVSDQSSDIQDIHDMHGKPEPHVHLKRGEAKPTRGGSSPVMTLHGGNVMTQPRTTAIFWGAEWQDSTFAGDKITGLMTFFSGYGGSNYAGTTTEYPGANGLSFNGSASDDGSLADTSAAPSSAISVTQAVQEACKMTSNNPDPNEVYFLYTSTGAGNVNYCAWHSWGNCDNGAPVQVAYMPNITGIAGCNPQDGTTGHSEGLAALANVTAHELSEAITDPRGTGWFDRSGAENGDKCAWTFTGDVTLSNGSVWKLQQEWSNAAYNASTGSPRGCIQGQ
jgi:hypothetical protein